MNIFLHIPILLSSTINKHLILLENFHFILLYFLIEIEFFLYSLFYLKIFIIANIAIK